MFRIPIVNNNGHRPLDPVDQLDPAVIPVSSAAGNQMQVDAEGLFVGIGDREPTQVFINTSTGVDAPTSGSQATPFKTLAYALSQIQGRPDKNLKTFGAVYYFNLMVGQTFELTSQIEIQDTEIHIGFYGDARGQWNTQIGLTQLQLLSDVNRPVLKNRVLLNANSLISCSKFLTYGSAKVYFHGLNIELAEPSGQTGTWGVPDLVDGPDLEIIGCRVNKLGYSFTGLLSVRSDRTQRFRQYGSEFLIKGKRINTGQGVGGITLADLEARKHFIHFYLGAGAADFMWDALQLDPDALNSSNGSGILTLLWTDTGVQSIGGVNSWSTYPPLADASFGLAQYMRGLRRDQQGRPTNVISGRSF